MRGLELHGWMWCVELGCKKLSKLVYIHFMGHACENLIYAPMQNTPQPCPQMSTFKNMIIIMKTNILVKFGQSHTASWRKPTIQILA